MNTLLTYLQRPNRFLRVKYESLSPIFFPDKVLTMALCRSGKNYSTRFYRIDEKSQIPLTDI